MPDNYCGDAQEFLVSSIHKIYDRYDKLTTVILLGFAG